MYICEDKGPNLRKQDDTCDSGLAIYLSYLSMAEIIN